MTSEVANVTRVLAGISEHWQPHRLASVNDYDVKIVKLRGEFVWHTHPETWRCRESFRSGRARPAELALSSGTDAVSGLDHDG